MQDERELFSRDQEMRAVGCTPRLLELAALQALVVDGQSVVLPLEQFDGVESPVDEDEHPAVGDLPAHVHTDQSAQSVEAFAEVCHALVPVVPRIGIDVQQAQPCRS